MVACYCDESSISALSFHELRNHSQIDLFHDSAAFKDALRKNKYTAILLGFNMDFLAELQSDPHYNGCPIILTNGTHEELMFKILNRDLKLGSVSMVFPELKTYLFGKPVNITLIEMKMLRLLIKNYPAIVTKEELANDVWPSQKILPTTINTHIYNLRSKFQDWEFEVLTIKSQGYALVAK